ncbi:hypothetical protein EAI_09801 [Harpegnathos saltator]|uniref:Uncharacterized protein n=1 Tax=Harpegnathos saltator TaxID=610380 RepID=E2B6V9_HARSA|nr:hypothetical protein EAI_09801 [Harpegnathos saltator]
MWTDFAKIRNPTPATTDLIPITWILLKPGNIFDYLDIGKKLRMKTARKGEQRYNWKKIRKKL